MRIFFNHEKLRVYQQAIEFVAWADEALRRCEGNSGIKDQLVRASASVVLNIAEGNGKRGGKDRGRFFDIARGSALECAACLDVLVAKRLMTAEEAERGKEDLQGGVFMLAGLIGSASENVAEAEAEYGMAKISDHDHDQDQDHDHE